MGIFPWRTVGLPEGKVQRIYPSLWGKVEFVQKRCEFCFWGRMRWLYINLKKCVFRLHGKVLETFLPNVTMVKSPVRRYLLPCFPYTSTKLRLIAAHKTCMQMKCHQIQIDSTCCLKYVICGYIHACTLHSKITTLTNPAPSLVTAAMSLPPLDTIQGKGSNF